MTGSVLPSRSAITLWVEVGSLPTPSSAARVLQFVVLLEWDEAGKAWNVSLPAIEGCFTFGESVEEALRNAEEAIVLNLEDMAARGEALPRPDAVRAEVVAVPAPNGK